MKVEIYRDYRREWRFRIVAGNGKIVAQSEGYVRKVGAERAVAALVRDLPTARTVYSETLP